MIERKLFLIAMAPHKVYFYPGLDRLLDTHTNWLRFGVWFVVYVLLMVCMVYLVYNVFAKYAQ